MAFACHYKMRFIIAMFEDPPLFPHAAGGENDKIGAFSHCDTRTAEAIGVHAPNRSIFGRGTLKKRGYFVIPEISVFIMPCLPIYPVRVERFPKVRVPG